MDVSVTMGATISLVVDVQQTPKMCGNRISSNVHGLRVGFVRGNYVGDAVRAVGA